MFYTPAVINCPAMSLPVSLLTAAETHACFSGCFSRESPVHLCIDPSAPPVKSIEVQCQDCLTFRLGVLSSLLPAGYDAYRLARDLTDHISAVRGYAWAVSGYHAVTKPGFWFSAVSFGNGLLLADAGRNSGGGDDLDTLIQAFTTGVAAPDDPGMLDPKQYAAEEIYVDLSIPFGPVRSKQDILQSSQCSRFPRNGHHRVTLLEYLPMVQAVAHATANAVTSVPGVTNTTHVAANAAMIPSPPLFASVMAAQAAAPSASPRPLAPGERCPICGALFMRRQLLLNFYDGCLC